MIKSNSCMDMIKAIIRRPNIVQIMLPEDKSVCCVSISVEYKGDAEVEIHSRYCNPDIGDEEIQTSNGMFMEHPGLMLT